MNLTQAQQAVERADLAATEARAERNRLAQQARDEGRTIYAIAAELGVTQNAVRRMLGLRWAPSTATPASPRGSGRRCLPRGPDGHAHTYSTNVATSPPCGNFPA